MIYILFLSTLFLLILLIILLNKTKNINKINTISFYIIYYIITSLMILSRGLQNDFFGEVSIDTLIYLSLIVFSTLPGLIVALAGSNNIYPDKLIIYERYNKLIKSLVVVSVAFCILLFVYNVFFFSSGHILDYFHNAHLIRRRRFEFNYTGAPLIYSILEYFGYSYIGLISVCYFYIKNRKRLVKYISLLFLSAIIFSITYSSRTPLVIFFTLNLASLIFKSSFLKKVLAFLTFKNIVIFILTWLAFNFIAITRDASINLTANAIEAYSNIKVSRDIITLSFLSNSLYLSTSLNNLSDIINQNNIQDYYYGLKSFGSMFSFIRKLGINFNVFDEAFSAAGITNQTIFGRDVVYNSTTTYDTFIQDFGKYGSILFLGFFFTLSSMIIHNVKKHIFLFYFGSVLMLWAVNSPFLNVFSSWGKAIFSGFVVVVCFSILELVLKRSK